MEKEAAFIIATLIPVDDRTDHVFSCDANRGRCLPPMRGRFDEEGLAISSREPTPACVEPQDNTSRDDDEDWHRLLLIFQKLPKNPAKGYAFGTDEQKCDILLGPNRAENQQSSFSHHVRCDPREEMSRVEGFLDDGNCRQLQRASGT